MKNELTPFQFGVGGTGRKALKALFDVGRGYMIEPYRMLDAATLQNRAEERGGAGYVVVLPCRTERK